MKRVFVAVVVILILMLNHLVAKPLDFNQLKALASVFDDVGATTSEAISVFCQL